MKIVERQVGKYRMLLSAKGGGIHKTLRGIGTKKEREPELLYILRTEIKNKMTCMDIGANIGYVTLLMADLVGSKGRVYAVEPDPANFKLLKANIKLNSFKDRVLCYDIAMHDNIGKVNFYAGKNASNLGSLVSHKKSVNEAIEVKCDTMDNFFKDKQPPELIKMDLEGGEVGVFAGMYGMVKAKDFPCKIVMELHPQFYPKEKGLEYWMRKFFNKGFKVKLVISAAVPQPDLFIKWGYGPIRVIRGKGFYDSFIEEHAIIASCQVNKQWMERKQRYSPKIARYIFIERS